MILGMRVRSLKALIVVCIVLSVCVFDMKACYSASIGKINLQAIILLHPAMKSYSPNKMAFQLDTSMMSKSLVKAQEQERQNKINELENIGKQLASDIVAEHRNHDALLLKMSKLYLSDIEKLATGSAIFKRKRYTIEEDQAEATHRGRLVSLSSQLRANEKKIERLIRVRGGVGYANPEDSAKKMREIISEIRKYTKSIAAKKGINIVLNSSKNILEEEKRLSSSVPDEIAYSKVFQNKFPKKLLTDSAAVSGYYSEVYSIAHNWLVHGDNILRPFSAQLTNTDVFIGGVDLTSEVIAAIFKAHRIDKNLTNVVIKAATTF